MLTAREAPNRQERQVTVYAIPEAQIAMWGFGLSVVWEFLQSPFYTDTFEAPWPSVVYDRIHCSVGDALILLGAFWVVALLRGRAWIVRRDWGSVVLFAALGVGFTIVSEYVNVHLLGNWAYTRWMPTVAGIGLSPILQWVVIPALVTQVVRKSRERAAPLSGEAGGRVKDAARLNRERCPSQALGSTSGGTAAPERPASREA